MIEKILEKLKVLTHNNPMVTDNYILRKDAIEIVQEVAKEYGAINNDLTVVSSLPSLYPLQSFEEEAIQRVVASASVKNRPWIYCNKRLPEESKLVLIYAESTARGGSIRCVAELRNGFWFAQIASDTLGLTGIGQYKVIKWAELPEV